ncbi:DUF3099 domain-containing protein [Nocardioides flavescens]|uniref:DUF3099 domain-containing protein n=1 Tax=Nocardioides flavescens TaxID=2691959 RepID=UPI00301DFBA7
MQRRTRRRAYAALMGTCVVLIVLAWNVVRLWSTGAAVAMSIVAALMPPVAAIVANLGALDDTDLPRERAPRPRLPRDPDR